MKNFLLLGCSAVLFCLGLALSIYEFASLFADNQSVIGSYPDPLPFSIFCGFIIFLLVFIQVISPSYSLYAQKLRWQRKYNYLSKHSYQKKINGLIIVRNIVSLVVLLTSWLVLPILFYLMAFVFTNIFVSKQKPNEQNY